MNYGLWRHTNAYTCYEDKPFGPSIVRAIYQGVIYYCNLILMSLSLTPSFVNNDKSLKARSDGFG